MPISDINQHGLSSPISWDEVYVKHNWIAIDKDGDVFSFKSKPYPKDTRWRADDNNMFFLIRTQVPSDFTQCLWQRPKSETEESELEDDEVYGLI